VSSVSKKLFAGCNLPPDQDLTHPADPPGQRTAGGGGGLREAESDPTGLLHRWIQALPDHPDPVGTRLHAAAPTERPDTDMH
jgi:hypothetical protein